MPEPDSRNVLDVIGDVTFLTGLYFGKGTCSLQMFTDRSVIFSVHVVHLLLNINMFLNF